KKVENQVQEIISQQEGFLKNAVVNVEEQITAAIISNVTKKTAKNQFEDVFNKESDVITKQQKKESENELELAILAFYGIIMSLEGGEQMRSRVGEFGMGGQFDMTGNINSYMKSISSKVAASHVD